MSRRKKKRSIHLDKAQARLAALRSIKPVLDFGAGLTTQTYADLIVETRQTLADYNSLLTKLDQVYSKFKTLERSLTEMTTRMLIGVATQYGKESIEYKMAGGTRPSERRRHRHVSESEAELDGETLQ
jgi:hypothetical protein